MSNNEIYNGSFISDEELENWYDKFIQCDKSSDKGYLATFFYTFQASTNATESDVASLVNSMLNDKMDKSQFIQNLED